MQSSTPNNSQPPPPPPPQDPDEARRARRRVAAEQRKRIANACLACKSRKQKCDGQQPCNICSRRSASCVYVEQPPRHLKRRRATPQTGDDPSDRTSLRSTRSPCSPGQNPQTLSTTTGASPQRQRCDSIASILQADTRYVYPTPVTANPIPPTSQQAEATESTDEDDRVEAPVDYRTRMLSDPKGRLLYIGETGSLSFLARVRKMVENSLGPSNFTSDSAQNSIADKPAVPRQHPAPGTFPSLPDMPNATALIDYFFANVNCIHYVLDRAEMTQIISSVYSPGNVMSVTGDRDRDIALVNAVCAVGTFFTVQNEVSAQQGMRYFDTARTVIEDVFESADFWSIRLLLLFALYMHYAAKRNASWTYIGLAIRIAESLGLHRISTVEQFRGDHERRRRLVFWSLYNLDRFTGCSLGRPLAIQDENCNDPVFSTAPSNDILVDRHCDGDPVDPNHHIHQMVARVRLHVIIGHIIKLVYLRRTISRDVAEALSDELKAWWKALPPCASLDNLNCGGKDWSIVQLHMSYLHAVTLLTRPFLQRVVEASIEEITGKTADGNCPCKRKSSGKSNVKRKMLRYAGACVLVAERTVALAHRMRRRGNLQRNDATLIYYLFTAGLILTFSVLPQVLAPREDHGHEEDMLANFRNRSPALIALMGECASVETCIAKRYHSVLQRFTEALIQGSERRQAEEQAQKTRERETSDIEEKPVEPDLLDELRATSNEYFAGSYEQSRAVSAEPDASAAAHALVSVASNGQITPHQHQTIMLGNYLDTSSSAPPGLPLTPAVASPHYDPAQMLDKDPEVMAGMIGLTDFSSFFGWLDDGFAAPESAAIPWEFSWDGPPSNYFMSAHAGMSSHGRPM